MGTRSISGVIFKVSLSATITNMLKGSTPASAKQPSLSYSQSAKQPSLSYSQTIENGIGAGQANRGWQGVSLGLDGGSSQVIDLYDMAGINIGAGDGKDGVGQPVDFEEIVAIAIVNDNAIGDAGALEIEPDETNGWTPIGSGFTAANGGALYGQGIFTMGQPAEAGFNVVDGSSHRIKLTAVYGYVAYSIYLVRICGL